MTTKQDETYSGKDIVLLTDQEHVRLRTQIYLGNMRKAAYRVPSFVDGKMVINEVEFVPAAYKAINEIIDNSIDEFANTKHKRAVLNLTANPATGEYTVADNGRGIPIDVHESGLYTPEVALGSLRAGRNFSNEKEAGVIGQNGVGSSCTNFCSEKFEVAIHRDGKKYVQKFRDGGSFPTKPVITKSTANSGTEIHFKLDPLVFKDTSLPDELVVSRAHEIAFNNPSITVNYNGTKIKYNKGLEDIVKSFSDQYFKFSTTNMEFFVIFDVNKNIDEEIFTWVNSSLLFDGGICNTQFLNAFFDKTVTSLEAAAKRQKCKITKDDVKPELLVLGSLKVADPEYDAQSKTRLTGPNFRNIMREMINADWPMFSRKHKTWLDDIIIRAKSRHHSSADKKAVSELEKSINKKIPGLLDATSKIRFLCSLMITEGESAAGMIGEVRDSKLTGSLPLTGKINNVYDSSVSELLKMTKVANLLQAMHLIPGKKIQRGNLNFGRLIIATDADPDGAHIFTLLINLLFKFWPDLFDPSYDPIIYRLNAPNVVASKGKRRIHFTTMEDFRKVEHKYTTGWEIEYFKGLGSMQIFDWEMIFSDMDKYIAPVIDDGNMKQTLKLLFSDDSDARKEWLT